MNKVLINTIFFAHCSSTAEAITSSPLESLHCNNIAISAWVNRTADIQSAGSYLKTGFVNSADGVSSAPLRIPPMGKVIVRLKNTNFWPLGDVYSLPNQNKTIGMAKFLPAIFLFDVLSGSGKRLPFPSAMAQWDACHRGGYLRDSSCSSLWKIAAKSFRLSL